MSTDERLADALSDLIYILQHNTITLNQEPVERRYQIVPEALCDVGAVYDAAGLVCRVIFQKQGETVFHESDVHKNPMEAARDVANELQLVTAPAHTAGYRIVLQNSPKHYTDILRVALASLPKEPLSIRPPPTTEVAARTSVANEFRRQGQFWTLTYSGDTVMMKDIIGLRYIAHLISRQGKSITVQLLVKAVRGEPSSTMSTEELEEVGLSTGSESQQELIDDDAKANYKLKIEELNSREDSETDPAKQACIRKEREALERQLATTKGLGDRDRTIANDTEKIRVAVTQAINRAITSISEAHPPLGLHLLNAIKTGSDCRYTPDQPVDWQL